MRGLLPLLAAAALITDPASAQADLPPISTDRPSFSTSTSIAPESHFVLESGVTATVHDRDADENRRLTLPELAVRWGVAEDRLEAQASWNGWSRDGAGASAESGISDLTIGLKWRLTEQSRWVPRLVLVPLLTLGLGDPDFSSQEPDPALRLAWSTILASGLTVGGNANVAWISDAAGRMAQIQGSVYAAWAVWERTTCFAEYFLLGPMARDAGSADSVDAGLLHLLSRRVQADLRAGIGLDREADDFFVGAGLSFLF